MKLINVSERIFSRLFRIVFFINGGLLLLFLSTPLYNIVQGLEPPDETGLLVFPATIFAVLFCGVLFDSDQSWEEPKFYSERSIQWKILPLYYAIFLWIIY